MPNFIGQVPCVSSTQDSRVDGKIKDIWDLKDGEKSLSGDSVIWLKPATSGKWTFRADLLLGRTLESKFQNFILNSLRIPMVLHTHSGLQCQTDSFSSQCACHHYYNHKLKRPSNDILLKTLHHCSLFMKMPPIVQSWKLVYLNFYHKLHIIYH